MKHLVISCQKHKVGCLLLSFRYITNFLKTCSFLHAHFTETIKVVENVFKRAYGKKLILIKKTNVEVQIGISSMRQFRCVPTTYVTENKENDFENYTYQVACPLSLPLSLYPKLFIFA